MNYGSIYYLVVFLLLSAAIFLISDLGKGIGGELRRRKKAGAMRLGKRKPFTKLKRMEQKRRLLIAQMKLPPAVFWLMTCLCTIGGTVVGKFFFSNSFIAFVVGLLGAFSPLVYLNYKLTLFKNSRIEKLQSSMMILSNSYIVTEDLLKSVEDNVAMLELPEPFRDFLTYVSLVDGNIKNGLRRLENQVNNIYFSQWIDLVVMAQDDRSLKYVTMSIVDAMNDMHQAQQEAETAMYAIWREYFTVLILIFSAPVIFRILMNQAYLVLVTTIPGQVLLVLLLATAVFSLLKAIKLNKPLLM